MLRIEEGVSLDELIAALEIFEALVESKRLDGRAWHCLSNVGRRTEAIVSNDCRIPCRETLMLENLVNARW